MLSNHFDFKSSTVESEKEEFKQLVLKDSNISTGF